jgi:hypothetical protein
MHVTTFRSEFEEICWTECVPVAVGKLLGAIAENGPRPQGWGDPVGQTPWGLEPALSANSTQSDQSAASLRMLSRAARRAVEHSAVGYDLGDTKPEQVRLGPGKQ